MVTGQRVGGYEIVRPLARGGMAIVYLVRQPALDRLVVLKRLDLHSDDPRLAQRFVQEARLAARLDHPNVVTLFDFFEDGGVPFIAMEYVSGGSLRPLVGALTLPQVFGVAEGMLAGLRHAESRGISHRDVKPENVLLTGQGGVKIADFGIARAYNELTGRLTSTGMALGTPAYMAPEQAQDQPLGPYTDLYAVGTVVYELLAGRPPFHAETPVAVLWKHVHEPPPSLTGVPPAVREWVEWMLAKAPAERPQSAAEAWEALEEIAVADLGPYWRRHSAILARPAAAALPPDATTAVAPAAREPAPGRRSRRRLLVAGALALTAMAAGSLAVLTRGVDRSLEPAARDEPRPATPYDFDGDGRQELVASFVEGAARGEVARSGVVLVWIAGEWRVITQKEAGLASEPRRDDQFGSSITSGDFNGDGSADLAIGTPGKDLVSVLHGSPAGLLTGGTRQLRRPARLGAEADRYGSSVLGHDFDGDDYDDLVVGAAGGTADQAGAAHLLFGSPKGLRRDGSVRLRPPDDEVRFFGSRLRVGDVDDDGHPDLAMGSPETPYGPGYGAYCAGSARGPGECRRLGTGATSSLGIADVNSDDRADIVQGDVGPRDPLTGALTTAGEVRIWLGGPEGPRPSALRVTQDTLGVPGNDEVGDEFGAVVEAGDVDDDGYADLIVSSAGENRGEGRVTVVRGGHGGIADAGHSYFDQTWPQVPGSARADNRFGSSLTLLRLNDDEQLDLAVGARGVRAAERIMVIEGGRGVFAPSETKTRELPDVTRLVAARRGGPIRFARRSGG